MTFIKKINGEYIVCCKNKQQSSLKGKSRGRTKKNEMLKIGTLVKYSGNGYTGFVQFGWHNISCPKELVGKRIKLVCVELKPTEKMIQRCRK